MTYITTGERIGYERGKMEGREEGREELGQSLVLRQLKKRLGELPESVLTNIKALSLTQLEALGEALLDFTTIEDLHNWLQGNLATDD